MYIFARIARELARRRPEIPILVTQGRSRADALTVPDLGLAPHLAGQFPREARCDGQNIVTLPFQPDPWKFYPTVYSLTKLLLMPSLWYESFGLVAAEAMINGIPVLASNRGALPETIEGRMEDEGGRMKDEGRSLLPEGTDTPRRGEMSGGSPAAGCTIVPLGKKDLLGFHAGAGGMVFDIPAKYTPETRELPTAEEVEPWVETIIRLWDDAAEHERWSRAARERAQLWHPDRLAPIYREFFGSLTHQPGPPLAPRVAGGGT